jgi:hypothetical protein
MSLTSLPPQPSPLRRLLKGVVASSLDEHGRLEERPPNKPHWSDYFFWRFFVAIGPYL